MLQNNLNVNFNLRNPSAKDETPINLIIRYNSQKFIYSTSEKIKPQFWQNDKSKFGYQRVKRSPAFPEHPEFNTKLEAIASTVKTVFRRFQNDNDNQVPTPKKFKELLDIELSRKDTAPKNLIDYIKVFIEESKTRINPKSGKLINPLTVKKYECVLRHLNGYSAAQLGRKLEFTDIDNAFYDLYTSYLMREYNLATNSIGKDIATLKVFLSTATEKGVNSTLAFKSRKFVTLTEKSDSIYLTEGELESISKLQLTRALGIVRDLFLVGCFTGLRYSDYSALTKDHIKGDNIVIDTYKTGETVIIPLHRIVKRVFEKYQFNLPKSYCNQKTNEYLKEIGYLVSALNVEITKKITKGGTRIVKHLPKYQLITTHTARRSFATNLYLSGFPPISIMRITGHQTESSFMKYIKITPDDNARKLSDHWEQRDKLAGQKAKLDIIPN